MNTQLVHTPTGEWKCVNKTTWKSGPWHDEPDIIKFFDDATGYYCFMKRATLTGAWCGYVGIPNDHVLFGIHYKDIDAYTNVHGGLTFSDFAPSYNYWFFGFDCSHCFDYMPAMNFGRSAGYRNVEFVQKEVRLLALILRECQEIHLERQKQESTALLCSSVHR